MAGLRPCINSPHSVASLPAWYWVVSPLSFSLLGKLRFILVPNNSSTCHPIQRQSNIWHSICLFIRS